jgi:hypothetical protein
LAWMPSLETMHNTHRVPGPAAIEAKSRTLRQHTRRALRLGHTRIQASSHRRRPSLSRWSSIINLHIDVDLYSSLCRRITWFSVARVLAKTVIRHGDTLVLLSDEQIMGILRYRRRQLPRVTPVRCWFHGTPNDVRHPPI